jgi:hypothetical protein
MFAIHRGFCCQRCYHRQLPRVSQSSRSDHISFRAFYGLEESVGTLSHTCTIATTSSCIRIWFEILPLFYTYVLVS